MCDIIDQLMFGCPSDRIMQEAAETIRSLRTRAEKAEMEMYQWKLEAEANLKYGTASEQAEFHVQNRIALGKMCDQYQNENTALRERAKRMEEALQFYAHENIWLEIESDRGEVARTALEEST